MSFSRFARGHGNPSLERVCRLTAIQEQVVSLTLHKKDYPGALRTGGFCRSAGIPHKGCADGASIGLPAEIEGAGRYGNGVETRVSIALGVRGCPKSTPPKSAKHFEILVSAAGLEPATHALKGHCSTN